MFSHVEPLRENTLSIKVYKYLGVCFMDHGGLESVVGSIWLSNRLIYSFSKILQKNTSWVYGTCLIKYDHVIFIFLSF
jgi:hypothetical protein